MPLELAVSPLEAAASPCSLPPAPDLPNGPHPLHGPPFGDLGYCQPLGGRKKGLRTGDVVGAPVSEPHTPFRVRVTPPPPAPFWYALRRTSNHLMPFVRVATPGRRGNWLCAAGKGGTAAAAPPQTPQARVVVCSILSVSFHFKAFISKNFHFEDRCPIFLAKMLSNTPKKTTLFSRPPLITFASHIVLCLLCAQELPELQRPTDFLLRVTPGFEVMRLRLTHPAGQYGLALHRRSLVHRTEPPHENVTSVPHAQRTYGRFCSRRCVQRGEASIRPASQTIAREDTIRPDSPRRTCALGCPRAECISPPRLWDAAGNASG